MKKGFKKVGMVISLVLVVLFIMLHIRMEKQAVHTLDGNDSTYRIAIVNEDSGVFYHEKELLIGDRLVQSTMHHQRYPIDVVSRSVAERGLENNGYQLLILFPNTLSQELTALEEVNPKKALFQYKVNARTQAEEERINKVVAELTHAFNKEVIHIYFNSLISYLQQAQRYVSESIGYQGGTRSFFQQQLSQKLVDYSDSFKGISSATTQAAHQTDEFHHSILQSRSAFEEIASVDTDYLPEVERIQQLQHTWEQAIAESKHRLQQYSDAWEHLSIEQELIRLQEYEEIISHVLQTAIEKDEALFQRLKNQLLTITTYLNQWEVQQSVFENDEWGVSLQKLLKEKLLEAGFAENVETENIKQAHEKLKQTAKQLKKLDNHLVATNRLSKEDVLLMEDIHRFVLQQQLGDLTEHSSLQQLEKECVERLSFITGEMTISSMGGKPKTLTIVTDDRYKLTSLSINGKQVAFQEQGHAFVVSEGIPSEDVLQVDYKLHINPKFRQLTSECFRPILVTATLVTQEELASVEHSIDGIEPGISLYDRINEWNTTIQKIQNVPDEKDGRIDLADIYPLRDMHIAMYLVTRKSSSEQIHHPSVYCQQQMEEMEQQFLEAWTAYHRFVVQVEALYGASWRESASHGESQELATSLSVQGWIERAAAHITKNIQKQLVVPDEWIHDIEQATKDIAQIEGEIIKHKETMHQLQLQMNAVLSEARQMQHLLEHKPVLSTIEEADHANLIQVTLSMHQELVTLMNASRELMKNTKEHQRVSSTVQEQLHQLDEQVHSLEQNAHQLEENVQDFIARLHEGHTNGLLFLENFENVMSNAKDGVQSNTSVYDYLSHPIAGKKSEFANTAKKKHVEARLELNAAMASILLYMGSLGVAVMFSYAREHARSIRRLLFNRLSIAGSSLLLGSGIGLIYAYGMSLSLEKGIWIVALCIASEWSLSLLNALLIERIRSWGMLVSIAGAGIFLMNHGLVNTFYTIEVSTMMRQCIPLYAVESALKSIQQQTHLSYGDMMVISIPVLMGILQLIYVAKKERTRK